MNEEKGITTISLKQINKEKVYQYIYRHKQTSKLQIVQELQMGLSTVSQNLTSLEKEGLIERKGSFESTGGRKAQIIQIVPDFKLSIGLGILKNMFHIVAVNLYGETIASDTIFLPYSDRDEYYDEAAAHVERFIRNHCSSPDKIIGISIATQGLTSPDGSFVTYGAIMKNSQMKLSDFSLRLPYPCHLEHDSKAAAYLELWNHRDLDSAVVFLLNRNLGGAVITNSTVHQGISMHSGALEHICVNPNGPVCYCKNRGCLETYCSANALESISGMPAKDFFPALRSGGHINLEQIWADYLNHLAFAVRNLNMVIDSPVILSGYLAPYFEEQDMVYLLEQVNGCSPFPMKKEQFIIGTHGQLAPAVGAALYYVKEFIGDISMHTSKIVSCS